MHLFVDYFSTEEGEGKGWLMPEMIWKFSRHAQHYILAYFYLKHDQEHNIDEEGLDELNIERIKMEIKTHRNEINFDEAFISHCFRRHQEEASCSHHHDETSHVVPACQ